jgi:SAM-dependent methyltransferase
MPISLSLVSRFFSDKSTNAFTDPQRCVGNLHLYVIRKSILKFIACNAHNVSGDIIDLGCGSSPYKDLLLSSNQSITSYTGIDIADSPYHSLTEDKLLWNGSIIPLPDNSCDCVLLTEVIEHLLDPSVVLSEICRVLRPNGTLIATIPFIYPLHEIPFDFRRLTPFEVERLMQQAGFSVLTVTRFGGWDRSFAQMIGLWLTFRPMKPRLRKLLMLLAYPFYSLLLNWDGIESVSDISYSDSCFVGLGVFAQK